VQHSLSQYLDDEEALFPPLVGDSKTYKQGQHASETLKLSAVALVSAPGEF
jgi:hypothetical protein